MTEAMPFLQKAILLSYAPRSFVPGAVFLFRAARRNRRPGPASAAAKRLPWPAGHGVLRPSALSGCQWPSLPPSPARDAAHPLFPSGTVLCGACSPAPRALCLVVCSSPPTLPFPDRHLLQKRRNLMDFSLPSVLKSLSDPIAKSQDCIIEKIYKADFHLFFSAISTVII